LDLPSDGFECVVKSIGHFDVDNETETEKLRNRRHPCVAVPVGFAVSSNGTKLKSAHKKAPISSLDEVLQTSPSWWTATLTLIAVMGTAQLESEINQGSFR
jgi:hypothetical protein